jgi:hypothetical protein
MGRDGECASAGGCGGTVQVRYLEAQGVERHTKVVNSVMKCGFPVGEWEIDELGRPEQLDLGLTIPRHASRGIQRMLLVPQIDLTLKRFEQRCSAMNLLQGTALDRLSPMFTCRGRAVHWLRGFRALFHKHIVSARSD